MSHSIGASEQDILFRSTYGLVGLKTFNVDEEGIQNYNVWDVRYVEIRRGIVWVTSAVVRQDLGFTIPIKPGVDETDPMRPTYLSCHSDPVRAGAHISLVSTRGTQIVFISAESQHLYRFYNAPVVVSQVPRNITFFDGDVLSAKEFGLLPWSKFKQVVEECPWLDFFDPPDLQIVGMAYRTLWKALGVEATNDLL